MSESGAGLLALGLRGLEVAEDEVDALRALQPAAVILFRRNVGEAEQVHGLCRRLHELVDRPLLLIDQEGGRVDRLRPVLGPTPSARRLAARGAACVRRQAEATASALRLLGFGLNCAPVLDLDEGHEGNGIGDRSYGADPAHVVSCAREVIESHAAAGLLACLKHFPGLGRTRADTHELRPQLRLDRDELRARELVPFRALVPTGQPVMVGHASLPLLEDGDEPASLSRAVVGGLLREELGHDGLVLTDDLEMGGVTDLRPGERARRALAAGCDVLLFCHSLDEAEAGRRAIEHAGAEGRLEAARVRAARRRVDRARAAVSRPPARLDRERLAAVIEDLRQLEDALPPEAVA